MLTNFLCEKTASVLAMFGTNRSRLSKRNVKEAVNAPYRGTALGLLEAEGHIQPSTRLRPDDQRVYPTVSGSGGLTRESRRASLFLEPIFFADAGVEEEALGFVFRFHDDSGVATLTIFGLLIVSSIRGACLEARAVMRGERGRKGDPGRLLPLCRPWCCFQPLVPP